MEGTVLGVEVRVLLERLLHKWAIANPVHSLMANLLWPFFPLSML